MSNSIERYNTFGSGLSREARRASRSISRSDAHRAVRSAEIFNEGDIAAEKIDAVSFVTGSAMVKVAQVAQAQAQLEVMAPQASGRLNYLAETHALVMGETLADLSRELRRR